MQQPGYHIFPLGDAGLTISFGETMDISVNERVIALFYHLQELRLSFVLDVVPAYSSLTLYYDVVQIKGMQIEQLAFDYVVAQLHSIIQSTASVKPRSSSAIRIPVCYDAEYGPDLELLSALKGCSEAEIIQWHISKTYRVYMIGFLPGFPYMGTVDERLATPRKAEPRTHVPAGSVGIAGMQTGIYPVASPGGWQIIGRTPLILFDQQRSNPVLLKPGDEVEFYAITKDEFENY